MKSNCTILDYAKIITLIIAIGAVVYSVHDGEQVKKYYLSGNNEAAEPVIIEPFEVQTKEARPAIVFVKLKQQLQDSTDVELRRVVRIATLKHSLNKKDIEQSALRALQWNGFEPVDVYVCWK